MVGSGSFPYGPAIVSAIKHVFGNNDYRIRFQEKYHVLTGESAFNARRVLAGRLSDRSLTPEMVGYYSHAFQDAYAHTRLQVNWLTKVVNATAVGNLYNPGIGHFFALTTPDSIDANPTLFTGMAVDYYVILNRRYGPAQVRLSDYTAYTRAIADVPESYRERFIQYIVGCDEGRTLVDNLFKRILDRRGLKQLGLDPDSDSFALPQENSLNDNQALRAFLFDAILRDQGD